MWGAQVPKKKSSLLSFQPTLAIGSILLVLPMTASAVLAQTWTGETSSNWFDATNWSTGAVPTDSDFAYVDTESPNATVISDQVSNGTAEADDMIVGNSSKGSLTIENGGQLILDDAIAIGFNKGSNGSVVVSGSTTDGTTTYASTLNSAGGLIVGSEGKATLTISEGGAVIAQSIGGPITVADGEDSTASIIIGSAIGQTPNDPGTISATGISIVEAGGGLVFNHTATSTDPYVFSVPISSLSGLKSGTITVAAGYTELTGDNSGYAGTTTVDGGTLVVDVALGGSALTVGDSSTESTMVIQQGGQSVQTGNVIIGNNGSSSGSVTVTGESTDGTASSLSVAGNFYVGNKGTAALTVSSGATVDANNGKGTITVARESGSNGTVVIGAASGSSAAAPGTLSAASLQFGSGTGTLVLNHTGTEADATELAFTISGKGTIDVEAGFTELSADNSGFSGTTTVDVGTLAITGDLNGNALNVGSTGTGGMMSVTNTAVVNISGDATIGVSSGSSGTVTVSGATSGSTVDASTLKVSNDLVVGASGSGTLIVNNSGLININSGNSALTVAQSAGSTGSFVIGSQSGNTALGTGTLKAKSIAFGEGTGSVLFNHSDDSGGFEFAVPFTGSGTIEVEGGTTVLTSKSTSFTGQTNINGGILSVTGSLPGAVVVNNGGTLGGTGTLTGAITVNSGGTIMPGSSVGTLNTADVTFESGGIFDVEIDSDGNVDLLASTGTVTIDGGSVLVSADSYSVDTTFTILTADTAVSGTFSGVSGTSTFIDYTLGYDATDVTLTQSVSQSFASVGETENQLAVAKALDLLDLDHEVVQLVFGSASETEARGLFDKLSGQTQASLKGALMTSGRKVTHTVNQRLGGSFQDDTQVFAYGSTKTNSHHGAWIAGYGGWEDIDSTGNTAAADNSYGGIVAGLDRDFGRHWRLGLLGAYGHTETSQSALSSSASADSFAAGAYGQATHGPVFVNFGGLFTWHDIDSSRSVTLRRKSQTLTAGYDATSWQLFSEAGYRIDRGDTRIEPFANLSFMQLDTDGYTETGGSAALTAASDTQSTTFTTLGLRVAQQMTQTVQLHGMAGWRHAFGDTDPSATFALAGSIPFTVTGAPIAVDALVIQAGFDVEAKDNVTFGMTYDGQFGDGSSANQIEGHLRVLF